MYVADEACRVRNGSRTPSLSPQLKHLVVRGNDQDNLDLTVDDDSK